MLGFLVRLIKLPILVPLIAVQRIVGGEDDRERSDDDERPPAEHPTETEHGGEEQTREQPDNPPAEEQDTAAERDEGGSGSDPDESVASGSEEQAGPAAGGGEEQTREQQPEKTHGYAGEAPAGPSLGPHTDLSEFKKRREEHYQRMQEKEPTTEDAMGLDKRRKIVGGTYGPTRTRLIATFTVSIALIVAAGVGLYLLVGELDQPPKNDPAKAPWSASDAPQRSPKSIQ